MSLIKDFEKPACDQLFEVSAVRFSLMFCTGQTSDKKLALQWNIENVFHMVEIIRALEVIKLMMLLFLDRLFSPCRISAIYL